MLLECIHVELRSSLEIKFSIGTPNIPPDASLYFCLELPGNASSPHRFGIGRTSCSSNPSGHGVSRADSDWNGFCHLLPS